MIAMSRGAVGAGLPVVPAGQPAGATGAGPLPAGDAGITAFDQSFDDAFRQLTGTLLATAAGAGVAASGRVAVTPVDESPVEGAEHADAAIVDAAVVFMPPPVPVIVPAPVPVPVDGDGGDEVSGEAVGEPVAAAGTIDVPLAGTDVPAERRWTVSPGPAPSGLPAFEESAIDPAEDEVVAAAPAGPHPAPTAPASDRFAPTAAPVTRPGRDLTPNPRVADDTATVDAEAPSTRHQVLDVAAPRPAHAVAMPAATSRVNADASPAATARVAVEATPANTANVTPEVTTAATAPAAVEAPATDVAASMPSGPAAPGPAAAPLAPRAAALQRALARRADAAHGATTPSGLAAQVARAVGDGADVPETTSTTPGRQVETPALIRALGRATAFVPVADPAARQTLPTPSPAPGTAAQAPAHDAVLAGSARLPGWRAMGAAAFGDLAALAEGPRPATLSTPGLATMLLPVGAETARVRDILLPTIEAPVTLPHDASAAEPVHTQIVKSMRLQWSGGGGEARVSLRPEYLGEVVAKITVQDGVVTATLHADTPEVRRAIEAQAATLRDALVEHGLRLDKVVVAEPDTARESGDRRSRGRQPQPQPQSPSRFRRRSTEPGATFDVPTE